MINRPTPVRLAEAKRKLTEGVPEHLYHHVWALIYEIDALKAVAEHSRNKIDKLTGVIYDQGCEIYLGGDDE